MLEESEPSENTHQDIQEPSAGPSGTQQQTERSELKPPEGPMKRRKRQHTNISADITKQRMDDAYKVFKKFSEVDSDSDECDLYGALLAKKLRALDEPTRETAMLQIDHLMFSIKHGTNPGHTYPQRNYSFQQRSSANQNLTCFYYQPPSNSHSQTNASFMPSPLSSPSVSSHYQPTFNSQPNSSFTPSPLTYQPPSNSHSQPNASSLTPSPLTSPVSPHYQPPATSSDSELSHRLTSSEYDENNYNPTFENIVNM